FAPFAGAVCHDGDPHSRRRWALRSSDLQRPSFVGDEKTRFIRNLLFYFGQVGRSHSTASTIDQYVCRLIQLSSPHLTASALEAEHEVLCAHGHPVDTDSPHAGC